MGQTKANGSIYQHGTKGARLGYQYIILFDTYLGHIPELRVDRSKLLGTNPKVNVTTYNENEKMQLLTISSGSFLSFFEDK